MDALRKQAKRWLRALRANDAAARTRLTHAYPNAAEQPTLRDVQHALAREYGFDNWPALKLAHVAARQAADADTPQAYTRIAHDLLLAFNDGDPEALSRLGAQYAIALTAEDLQGLAWGSVYAYRQRSSRGSERYLLPDEARTIVARLRGFSSWESLTDTGPARPARVPAYAIDERDNRIAPRRLLTDTEWDELLGVVQERGISTIDAGGQITDERLARIATLGHITSLYLEGSQRLTDAGLQHLARMPQLEHLVLTGQPRRITDAGLSVLGQLTSLRSFKMWWQRGISDAGIRYLQPCQQLEHVDVMGSEVGDGLIDALAGKGQLTVLKTGRRLTDAGFARLRDIPRLVLPPMAARDEGTSDRRAEVSLLVDGPFTNAGFAQLGHLQGVEDLDLFWHVTHVTTDAFAQLSHLPYLASIGADGGLSDDVALRHFAALPRLRKLRAQGAAASDAGFEALAKSPSLERFWGRECRGFGSRGFAAFSRMPSLRSLGVGLNNVEKDALVRFPEFRTLIELTPIGLQDDGFRHVGRCQRLERLVCMYCRDTTDTATRHIAALPLKYYYAGLTKIGDDSLDVLGRIDTLEEVELCQCRQITDAGMKALARLPRLRQVSVAESPRVTFAGMRVFPPRVRVSYST